MKNSTKNVLERKAFVPTLAPQSSDGFDNGIYLKSIVRSVLGKQWDIPKEAMTEQFIQQLQWLHLSCGEQLYEQGSIGDCMHVLLSGRLKVVKLYDGEVINTDEISSGECVGEMGLMSENPRSASIYAARDSVLVKITREHFDALCADYPTLLRQISKLVIDRLGGGKKHRPPAQVKNIAVIPLSENVDMDFIASRIEDNLDHSNRIVRLHHANADEYLFDTTLREVEEDPTAALRFNRSLEIVEHNNEYVIYQGNFSDDHWTRSCIRQADKIILVKDFYDTKQSAYREELMIEIKKLSYVSKTLVLVHSDGSRAPVGTTNHVELKQADRHLHIRSDTPADFGRLTRFITGKAVGLVLGGGGAKGFAHVGIIQRLREAGIPIDFVGGTSIGAIMGGTVAMDMDTETMIQRTETAFVKDRPLSDVTLPLVSYYSGKRLDRILRKNFGEQEIEDLWINFFCVSANLTIAGTMIHERGTFWKAVRASMSLPGAFPPVVMDNSLLVDGGLMNNVPVDIMAKTGVGKIIGIDLNIEKAYELDYDEIPGLGGLLRNKIKGKRGRIKIPSMMTILSKSIVLASYERASASERLADWYMRPPVQKFSLLNFKNCTKIRRIGYEYADEILADRPELLEEFAMTEK